MKPIAQQHRGIVEDALGVHVGFVLKAAYLGGGGAGVDNQHFYRGYHGDALPYFLYRFIQAISAKREVRNGESLSPRPGGGGIPDHAERGIGGYLCAIPPFSASWDGSDRSDGCLPGSCGSCTGSECHRSPTVKSCCPDQRKNRGNPSHRQFRSSP